MTIEDIYKKLEIDELMPVLLKEHNKRQFKITQRKSQNGSFRNIFNWCNCCTSEEEKGNLNINNNIAKAKQTYKNNNKC